MEWWLWALRGVYTLIGIGFLIHYTSESPQELREMEDWDFPMGCLGLLLIAGLWPAFLIAALLKKFGV